MKFISAWMPSSFQIEYVLPQSEMKVMSINYCTACCSSVLANARNHFKDIVVAS